MSASTAVTSPGGATKDDKSQSSDAGGSELSKIEKGLNGLPASDQRVVKDNLDRAGSYPPELPLSGSWTLYFSDTSKTKSATEQQYSDAQTELFQADTVPVLCGSLKAYKQAIRSHKKNRLTAGQQDTMGLASFRAGQNLHFFRSQVNPTWEDEWNSKGGRLTVTPPTQQLDELFESLVLLCAGESLETTVEQRIKKAHEGDGSEPRMGMINGVVANRRPRGDRIEVWLGGTEPKEAPPMEWIDELKKVLAEMLRMPELKAAKYKKHF